jgi:hypothetical protein
MSLLATVRQIAERARTFALMCAGTKNATKHRRYQE